MQPGEFSKIKERFNFPFLALFSTDFCITVIEAITLLSSSTHKLPFEVLIEAGSMKMESLFYQKCTSFCQNFKLS